MHIFNDSSILSWLLVFSSINSKFSTKESILAFAVYRYETILIVTFLSTQNPLNLLTEECNSLNENNTFLDTLINIVVSASLSLLLLLGEDSLNADGLFFNIGGDLVGKVLFALTLETWSSASSMPEVLPDCPCLMFGLETLPFLEDALEFMDVLGALAELPGIKCEFKWLFSLLSSSTGISANVDNLLK